MDTSNSSVNTLNPILLKKPQYKLKESEARHVPVIIVNLAYDIYTSLSDPNPTLYYNTVTIMGYTDGHGNIEFPENDVIWEQIDKSLILRHRLKRFNLDKSSFRILCNDGFMGTSHKFSNQIMCHSGENAYYLVGINQFVIDRVMDGSFSTLHASKYRSEIIVSYCCTLPGSGETCEGTVAVQPSQLDKRGIMNAIGKRIMDDGLDKGQYQCAYFQTQVDDGSISGVISYSGHHNIDRDRVYYDGEDHKLVDLGYAALEEFFHLYNKEEKWYQMI